MTDLEGNEIGKLFIGGLSQSTTNSSLSAYFSHFGAIEEAVVMMDNKTGRSRGFGYVKYCNPDSVLVALQAKAHLLDGKEVDAKQCNVNMKGRNRRSLKIFVGGIGLDQDADSLTQFFQQFGQVTDVNLMLDINKQRHRGFAFVGFDDEAVVKKLINMHFITMNNKQVEIKAMEPPNFVRRHGIASNQHYGRMNNTQAGDGMSNNGNHYYQSSACSPQLDPACSGVDYNVSNYPYYPQYPYGSQFIQPGLPLMIPSYPFGGANYEPYPSEQSFTDPYYMQQQMFPYRQTNDAMITPIYYPGQYNTTKNVNPVLVNTNPQAQPGDGQTSNSKLVPTVFQPQQSMNYQPNVFTQLPCQAIFPQMPTPTYPGPFWLGQLPPHAFNQPIPQVPMMPPGMMTLPPAYPNDPSSNARLHNGHVASTESNDPREADNTSLPQATSTVTKTPSDMVSLSVPCMIPMPEPGACMDQRQLLNWFYYCNQNQQATMPNQSMFNTTTQTVISPMQPQPQQSVTVKTREKISSSAKAAGDTIDEPLLNDGDNSQAIEGGENDHELIIGHQSSTLQPTSQTESREKTVSDQLAITTVAKSKHDSAWSKAAGAGDVTRVRSDLTHKPESFRSKHPVVVKSPVAKVQLDGSNLSQVKSDLLVTSHMDKQHIGKHNNTNNRVVYQSTITNKETLGQLESQSANRRKTNNTSGRSVRFNHLRSSEDHESGGSNYSMSTGAAGDYQ